MTIYFTHFPNHVVSLFNDSVLPALTSQQKRILIVASLALAAFAACLIACRCCCRVKITFNSDDDDSTDNKASTKITLTNGTKLKGEEIDDQGLLQGQGKITHPDGKKEKGEFKDGKLNGDGTVTYLDGKIEKGEFKDGKLNGKGKVILANKDTLEGIFKGGMLHGQGTYTYPNGIVKKGEFTFGKLVQGIIDSPHQGFFQEGTFRHEMLIKGTIKDGDKIITGTFQDGLLHGEGKITHPNGQIEEGTFDHGELVAKKL